jgi:hypothetical protein
MIYLEKPFLHDEYASRLDFRADPWYNLAAMVFHRVWMLICPGRHAVSQACPQA